MFEVIKGSNPFKNVVIEGEAVINNKIFGEDKNSTADGSGDDEEMPLSDSAGSADGEGEESESAEPPKINYAELEDLREQYRREGQEYAVAMHKRADSEFEKARAEAERLVEEAKEKGRRLLQQIGEKEEATYDEARKKGLNEGFGEGLKKGEEEGYIQGLKKCKEALLELKQLCERVEQEKAEIMTENRRGIFDLAMSVAEKVTKTVFSQKDKKALEKMITAAAKEFRNAKNIRVTLSKHDVSEDMEADFRIYEKCFAPNVNVEFEVVDGESGTLMLENDTEIFDAGVSTQLKMIGELGRGKFREKEEDPIEVDDIVQETAQLQPQPKAEVKTAKPRASRASKSAKAAAEAKAAPAETVRSAAAAVSSPEPVFGTTPMAASEIVSDTASEIAPDTAFETASEVPSEAASEIISEVVPDTVSAVASSDILGANDDLSAADKLLSEISDENMNGE